jgi:signal transduction histidine kinase
MKKALLYLRITFSASVLLLLLLALISYNKIQDLLIKDNAVAHTQEVLLSTEEVISIVKDAETGQRGFLLTHKRNYLEPFRSAYSRIERAFLHLDALMAETPQQRVRLDTLRKLTDVKFKNLNLAILNDTVPSYRVFSRTAVLDEGEVLMTQIRKTVSQIQQEEKKRLADRIFQKNEISEVTPQYILFVSGFALLLLLISFVLINRELRKRISVQQELQLKIEALNRSNAELEQFAYVASHDLQEPLRKIRAFGDRLMLKQQARLDDDGRILLQKIQDSSGRMQVLIDDLLTFSRMVNKASDLSVTDLGAVIKEVLADLSEPIRTQQATIETADLPVVLGFPVQMRQLFQNLISNALKFTKPGQAPQVSITSAQVSGSSIPNLQGHKRQLDYHQIIVQDSGIGFEPEYAERIFVIFQRLNGRLEYPGTGIGLAICRRVVTNHHGYIVAESQLGQGAIFYIYLPVTNPEKPESFDV